MALTGRVLHVRRDLRGPSADPCQVVRRPSRHQVPSGDLWGPRHRQPGLATAFDGRRLLVLGERSARLAGNAAGPRVNRDARILIKPSFGISEDSASIPKVLDREN